MLKRRQGQEADDEIGDDEVSLTRSQAILKRIAIRLIFDFAEWWPMSALEGSMQSWQHKTRETHSIGPWYYLRFFHSIELMSLHKQDAWRKILLLTFITGVWHLITDMASNSIKKNNTFICLWLWEVSYLISKSTESRREDDDLSHRFKISRRSHVLFQIEWAWPLNIL